MPRSARGKKHHKTGHKTLKSAGEKKFRSKSCSGANTSARKFNFATWRVVKSASLVQRSRRKHFQVSIFKKGTELLTRQGGKLGVSYFHI